MALEQRQLANVIRVLSMDAVERARSGHPGAPMGMADIATVLWREFLRHNPANPAWANRDRFVMSNGHGSMLLYAVLHLSGYDLSMDDLKAFRQLHSKTPGHPEYGCAPGVEATTGPLGQGVANAVGMALAERMLAARFNRPEFPLIAHHTYFFAGDGCLMEGISHEACSLAGTLRLGRLIGIYDDNGISIDGEVGGWFGDDTAQRFAAYGWHVQHGVDGHDPEQVRAALKAAVAEDSRPSLICCNTVIGWGAPEKQGTAAAHGAPLGESEWRRARDNLGWTQPPFVVPEEYYQAWDARTRGERLEREWRQCFADYQREYPELAEEFTRRQRGELPAAWAERLRDHVRECAAQAQDMATRKASMHSLTVCASLLPELIGGSADLSESNLTFHQHSRRLSGACMDGNYLHYGVREFAMVAIGNGIALHGGFIPYAGTFLMFSEYARNALRMAALMRLRQIFVFTHDSIGLGEDGPTHQAVEQAACLRLIPNMSVWRPADAAETAVAWQFAVERAEGPTCLLFSRQTVPCVERAVDQCELIRRGAYVLVHGGERPELIVIATGSELSLGCAAAQTLSAEGREVRVVSMPSCDVFDSQSQSYRDAVLPPDCRVRIAVEAGIGSYWRRYVGLDGAILGVDAFGESAPAQDVFAHFGFTETGLLERCRELLARQDAV